MRCNCCNKILSEKEIQWNKQINTWEMCSECLEISLDAAFSDGFADDSDDDLFVLVSEDIEPETVPFSDFSYYGNNPLTKDGDE